MLTPYQTIIGVMHSLSLALKNFEFLDKLNSTQLMSSYQMNSHWMNLNGLLLNFFNEIRAKNRHKESPTRHPKALKLLLNISQNGEWPPPRLIKPLQQNLLVKHHKMLIGMQPSHEANLQQKNIITCSCRLISYFFTSQKMRKSKQQQTIWLEVYPEITKNQMIVKRNKTKNDQDFVQNLLSYMCDILQLIPIILLSHFARLCSCSNCFNHDICCLAWQHKKCDIMMKHAADNA